MRRNLLSQLERQQLRAKIGIYDGSTGPNLMIHMTKSLEELLKPKIGCEPGQFKIFFEDNAKDGIKTLVIRRALNNEARVVKVYPNPTKGASYPFWIRVNPGQVPQLANEKKTGLIDTELDADGDVVTVLLPGDSERIPSRGKKKTKRLPIKLPMVKREAVIANSRSRKATLSEAIARIGAAVTEVNEAMNAMRAAGGSASLAFAKDGRLAAVIQF